MQIYIVWGTQKHSAHRTKQVLQLKTNKRNVFQKIKFFSLSNQTELYGIYTGLQVCIHSKSIYILILYKPYTQVDNYYGLRRGASI